LTIKEAEYFMLNGINSKDMGIINCSVSDGLFEEEFLPNQEIKEITIRGRERPYLIDVIKKPRILNLSFAFTEQWNDELINKVARWIGNNKNYVPLYFSSSPDKWYFVLYEGDISIIHNGLQQGYLHNIKFRCADPYVYSPTYLSQMYTTSTEDVAETGTTTTTLKMTSHGLVSGNYIVNITRNNTIRQVTKVDSSTLTVPEIIGQTNGDIIYKYNNTTKTIEFINNGDLDLYPELEIYKIGNGNLSIKNLVGGQEFKFIDISNGETLYVDCENENIITDKVNTYRFSNFNDNYLKIYRGVNKLQLTGDFDMQFRYQLKFLT
jgi:phage-related protein